MSLRDFFLDLHDTFWNPAVWAKQLRRPAFWGQLLLVNLFVCGIGFLLTDRLVLDGGALRWDLSRQVWRNYLASYVISFSCVTLGILTMPPLLQAISARFAFPGNWLLASFYFVLVGTLGSLIAFGIFAAVGMVQVSEAPSLWLARGLRISITTSLILGLVGQTIAALRGEVDRATMALRTKERDEAEAQRLVSEAQLASLEARVHPHFLFNTLNSIAALARRNPEGAERMAVQLASLLRSSLTADPSSLVPLHEELSIVRAYLDIERVRFGDRLRYTVEVPDTLMNVAIPRLSLQTMVENSVKYAVTPRRDGASIGIRASGLDRRARLEVVDDGPGFASMDFPPQHGLALVQARLKMLFGDHASLAVTNAPGASVTIEVPRD